MPQCAPRSVKTPPNSQIEAEISVKLRRLWPHLQQLRNHSGVFDPPGQSNSLDFSRGRLVVAVGGFWSSGDRAGWLTNDARRPYAFYGDDLCRGHPRPAVVFRLGAEHRASRRLLVGLCPCDPACLDRAVRALRIVA